MKGRGLSHNAYYLECSNHGFKFLRDLMWDKTYGGFYSLVDRQGNMKGDRKDAYGNAFGIFTLRLLSCIERYKCFKPGEESLPLA